MTISLSATQFIQHLKENTLPSSPYQVVENIALEDIKFDRDIVLGEGRFAGKFSVKRCRFEKNFGTGNSFFEKEVDLNVGIDGMLNFETSIFANSVKITDSNIVFIRFQESRFIEGFELWHSILGGLIFGKAKFQSCAMLINNKQTGTLDFGEAEFEDVLFERFEFSDEIQVGSNPAMGWMIQSVKGGYQFSLQQACEMCGSRSPLVGWIRVFSEEFGWRWRSRKGHEGYIRSRRGIWYASQEDLSDAEGCT